MPTQVGIHAFSARPGKGVYGGASAIMTVVGDRASNGTVLSRHAQSNPYWNKIYFGLKPEIIVTHIQGGIGSGILCFRTALASDERERTRNIGKLAPAWSGFIWPDTGTMVVTIVTDDPMLEIQLRDAKATLSKVIDRARQGQPSVITRHGRREAIVLSFAEWERLSRVPSFGRLLMAAALEPGYLLERQRGSLREANL